MKCGPIHIFATCLRRCFGALTLLTLTFTLSSSLAADKAPKDRGYKMIPIPKREHGYSNFKSAVIRSKAALKEFLKRTAKAEGMGWNEEKKFIEALRLFSRGRLLFHGGGGITVDSEAEAEFKETRDKVRAFLEALGVEETP